MRLQTETEEHLNSITHAIGAMLGIAGLVLLIIYNNSGIQLSLFSVLVYGISIIVLFLASTFYHAVRKPKLKNALRVVDHMSIYLLIAGTYTPVLLLMLNNSKGWLLFWIVWGIAGLGILLKIFFTGKYELFSTLLYLVMGWMVVFDFSMLVELMPTNGLIFLIAGGLSYTLGIVFYIFERIPFNHVIWHLFVLGGAVCHFFMIFLYVI
ncbi:MAG: hemolysin III family protein [Bacteroidia bacterium]|nr:hemolysin III family protein [Bacteroidia bacterium]MBT8268393.1 hemolysin III family protein [Bacteroidia bacterium]MBT8289018.1 hemolysin III family protein [Bacteroidia bacterium]NNK68833.1 hemolysin III family protein [Flavobacteriaceae bacterium]NNL80206.1 hemolysin III family protein [Flavobacteriaceae bacterium]